MLTLRCRDRQRCIATFQQALSELQVSPLLAQAKVSVTASEDFAGSELVEMATAATEALITVEQYMLQHPNGSSWHGQ